MSKLSEMFSGLDGHKKEETYTLEEYLEVCKDDPMAYATSAERVLSAIGEPTYIDTRKGDTSLSRIFNNKTVAVYEKFSDFYGMEDTIDKVVGYFKHAAQNLEEARQVLYLRGPVGSAKSSLAERIKELAEVHPVYVLKFEDEVSPVFESPLGLFSSKEGMTEWVNKEYGIPERYIKRLIASPWAAKRLKESGGNLDSFSVVKMWPSKLDQVCIVKTEPGDDNNQDISSLVGKTDISKMQFFSEGDTDAYNYCGGLCRGNQGVLEFVEMFKAPIKVLHPLLTATQEGNYKGTEDGLGAIPFNGFVLSHSNESEWESFKNDSKNEAFIDRIYTVTVPYCTRRDEEVKIYEKMLENSSLSDAPCAPRTLELLADFAIMSRIKDYEPSNKVSKMRTYNGESLRDIDPKAKTLKEYKDNAGVDEGMKGFSTRAAFKVLSKTFNHGNSEVSADPVQLMLVLRDYIKDEMFPIELENAYLEVVQGHMTDEYKDFIGKEIQMAYIENHDEYGQNLFDRYIEYADAYVQDIDYEDPETGHLLTREILNSELEKIEKTAGIANPKDFRSDVVNFVIRARNSNDGNNPKWTSYNKLKEVIEAKVFSNTEELLPVISFTAKSSSADEEKHNSFVDRMVKMGYSSDQVRVLVDWFLTVTKSS